MSARARAEAGLAFVALIWGATFVLVKDALDDVSISLFLTLRFSIAALLLSAFWYARRSAAGSESSAGGWFAGLATATFLYGGYLLQTLGLRTTTPAKSAFVTGLYIVFVPLLSGLVYRQMPRPAEWGGVGLASVGMALMTLDFSSFKLGRGDLLTVFCAFAFAIHILVLGHYSRRLDSDRLAMTQIMGCAALGLSTFWWIEQPHIVWSRKVIVAVVVTSILATALAFWIQTWGQKITTPTRAALIFSLEPVFGWLTAYAVANEVLSIQAVIGAVCILAGILLVELKPAAGGLHPPS